MTADKLVLTTYSGVNAAFLLQDSKLLQMQVDCPQDYQIGDIFIGKVKNIVPSIRAAFVQFAAGQIGFLPLSDCKERSILHHRDGRPLSCEDEIVVQIKKEPVKTKEATLTTDISFQSEHFVLMPYSCGIHFSRKLDGIQKQKLTEQLTEIIAQFFGEYDIFSSQYGLIVRTNAVFAPFQQLSMQLHDLFHQAGEVLKCADKRTVFSKLYEQESFYERVLSNTYHISELLIITDQKDVFAKLEESGYTNIRFYQDDRIDLLHLYGLHAQITESASKKVWLKSGGYLIIEPTEAMTVIDVNSGKAIRRKETESFILQINLEAAGEIARQLRLRNISGMILVDFINMKETENKILLMERLRAYFAEDPIETVLVDMTKLGLIEITRRKTTAPLADKLSALAVQPAETHK